MARSIKTPDAGSTFQAVRGLPFGMTGEGTPEGALAVLDGIPATRVGTAGGPIPLKEDGSIDASYFQGLSFNDNGVDGDATIRLGETKEYIITTYDSFDTYEVQAIAGTVSIDRNVITYTAPETQGVYGFRLNGRNILITVIPSSINKPAILYPLVSDTVSKEQLTVLSSVFEMSNEVEETHQSTDWEVSTDASFLVIVKSSYADTNNLTSWMIEDMKEFSKYYVRARYKGANFGYSEWSDPVSFTTGGMGLYEEQGKLYSPVIETDSNLSGVAVSLNNQFLFVAARAQDTTVVDSGAVFCFKNVSGEWVYDSTIVPTDPVSSSWFAISIATNNDGTALLVGCRQDDALAVDAGSVYYFVKNGQTWEQKQKITASDGLAYDYFGRAVALSSDGTYALIGATRHPYTGYQIGAVYAFTLTGESYIQSQKFVSSDGAAFDWFGNAIAISGDGYHAVIGAPNKTTKQYGEGRIYFFDRTGDTWQQTGMLDQFDAASNLAFGHALSFNFDGTLLAVGCDTNQSNEGSVYVYRKTNSGWVLQQRLTASDSATDDAFGFDVSFTTDGGGLVIVAKGDDDLGQNTGSVYIFKSQQNTWKQEQMLTAPDAVAGDIFGHNAAISGDGQHLLVGAMYDDDKASDAGCVYYYKRSGTNWVYTNKFYASDFATGDYFGSPSINYDGTYAVVGAHGRDEGGVTTTGMAYVFTRSGDVWTQQTRIVLADLAASWQVGLDVAISGDGLYIAIPARGDSTAGTNEGSVSIYTRTDTVWNFSVKLLPTEVSAGDQFGYAVELNNDASLLFISSLDNTKAIYAGAVYVYQRIGDAWSVLTKLYAPDGIESANMRFGQTIACDGSGSILFIGVFGLSENNLAKPGHVYIFNRRGDDWIYQRRINAENLNQYRYTYQSKIYISDPEAGDLMGGGVALSADGTKALIGVHAADDRGTESGAVYYFTRSGNIWTQVQKFTASDGVAQDCFGISVAMNAAGDYALIGAYADDDKGTESGSVYIFTRSGSTWTQQGKLTASDAATYDYYGYSVALNIDATYAAVGAFYRDDKGANSGSVYIYTRSGSTWTLQQKLTALDAAPNDFLGFSVALNQDATLLFTGATGRDDKGVDSGCIYIFNRNGTVWSQFKKIVSPDGVASDYFGSSIAINAVSSVLYIGAMYDDETTTNSGSVYIYRRMSDDWVFLKKIVAHDPSLNDYFGRASAIDATGSVLLVSAYGDDDKASDAGSVYFFTRDTRELYFGSSVSATADGKYLVVGAQNEDTAAVNAGSVYCFTNQPALYLPKEKMYAPDLYSHVTYRSLAEVSKKVYPFDAASNDNFGISCALNEDGTLLLVGAHGDDDLGLESGSVYVYIRIGTTWTFQQKLKALDTAASDYFGNAIALSNDGTMALISAFNDNTGAGSVYYFTRSGNVWTQQQKFTSSDIAQYDYFGRSVSLNTDATYALIGAYQDDDKGSASGSVYIFTRSGSVWTQQQKLTASDGAAGDYFGESSALNTDATVALIGARFGDSNIANSGVVYYYTRVGSVWTQKQKFAANDVAASDGFGVSVTLNNNGDLAAVGSFNDDDNGLASSGSVYIFKRDGDYWAQVHKIRPEDPKANASFGVSVSFSKDSQHLIIGAHQDSNASIVSGCFYYLPASEHYPYFGLTTEITSKVNYPATTQIANKITASDGAVDDKFGRASAIALNGTYALIGNYGDDDKGTDAGSVYVFTRSGTAWIQEQKFYSTDIQAGDLFGSSVAISSDGLHAIIGAPGDDDKGTGTGCYYYYTRQGNTWTQVSKVYAPDAVAANSQGSHHNFGVCVALNNDATIALVGANNDDTKATDAGAVYYFTRVDAVWTYRQKITASDGASSDFFGVSVALSADGALAIIGAYYDDDRASNAGSVYVFMRSGNIWTQQQKLYATDSSANSAFGTSVALNSDATEALIGAAGDSEKGSAAGAVYHFTRVGSTWIQMRKITASADDIGAGGDAFGISVAMSGDASVVLIGAYGDDIKASNAGAVLALYSANFGKYFGRAVAVSPDSTKMLIGSIGSFDITTGLSLSGCVYYYAKESSENWVFKNKFSAPNAVVGALFGASISTNATFDYCVIGSTRDSGKASNAGAAYIYTRIGDEWSYQQKITSADGAANDYFGISVALNSDATYLAVGAYGDDDKGADSGSVYIFMRSEAVWTQQQKLTAADGAAGDAFGFALTMNASGDFIAASAIHDDDKGTSSGSVYFFSRNGTTWSQVGKLIAVDGQSGDCFGASVSITDDSLTLVVGSSKYDSLGLSTEGNVYIYRKEGNNWVLKQKLSSADSSYANSFGGAVSISSNGSTIITGSYADDDIAIDCGAVYMLPYLGS